MLYEPLPLQERSAALDSYIARRVKRGFKLISYSETSAELYRPPGLPAFLFRAESLYVTVDEIGWVNVDKRHY